MSENPYEDIHCYIVIGSELEFIHMKHFRNLENVQMYGAFKTREEAHSMWKTLAMSTIDNAHMKYYIVKVY